MTDVSLLPTTGLVGAMQVLLLQVLLLDLGLVTVGAVMDLTVAVAVAVAVKVLLQVLLLGVQTLLWII